MSKPVPTAEELRARLSPLAFEVTCNKGTERAFTGAYTYHKERGVYACVCCGNELFHSDTKYDSGSGWPSFWTPLAGDRVREHRDTSYGMLRTEVVCANCAMATSNAANGRLRNAIMPTAPASASGAK